MYIALLSCVNFKKEYNFLPKYDQLRIARILNQKFDNFMMFSIY